MFVALFQFYNANTSPEIFHLIFNILLIIYSKNSTEQQSLHLKTIFASDIQQLSKQLPIKFIDFLFIPICYCNNSSVRFVDLISKQGKLGTGVLTRMNIQLNSETTDITSSLKTQSKSHSYQQMILKDFAILLHNFQNSELDLEEEEEEEEKCIICGLSKG
jgi:hypothetical protein